MEPRKVEYSCSNCRVKFSINNLSADVKHALPHILPCLHSACAHCVHGLATYTRPSTCHSCQAECSLSDEQARQIKAGTLSIEDIFPVDYQLFGMLVYDYYQDALKKGVNPEKIMLIQPAGARLYHVPKMRVCQPFKNATPIIKQELVLAPSKDVSKYLTQYLMCSKHDKSLDLYCVDCSQAVCTSCMTVCGKHDIVVLNDKNLEKEEELKIYKQAVGDIALRLRSTANDIAKKLPSSSKASLEEFSPEAALSRHFSSAHSSLQLLEQRLGRQLQQSRQGLLPRVEELTAKAQQLTDLVSVAEISLDDKYKHKINYDGIVKALQEVLDTPWYMSEELRASTLESDNFIINADIFDSALRLLESHCKVVKSDNEFKLLASSQIPPDTEIPPLPDFNIVLATAEDAISNLEGDRHHTSCNSSVKSISECGSVPPFRMNAKFPSENRSQPSSCSSSQKGGKPFKNRQLNDYFVQNATTSTVKKPLVIHPLLVGSCEKVVVTHISNPHEFYVRRVVMNPTLHEITDKFANSKKPLLKPTPEQILPGKYFVTYNKKYNQWERVKLLNFDESQGGDKKYPAFYIDYGHHSELKAEQLRVLDEDELSPPVAILCRLSNCQPKHGAWTEDASLTMLSIIQKSREFLIYVINITGDCHDVDLIACAHSLNHNDVSLAEALIVLEKAIIGPGNEVNRVNNKLPNVGQPKMLPRQKLYNDDHVMITHINTPAHFYVRKVSSNDAYETMITELNEQYNIKETAGTIYSPEVGMSVACYVEGQGWYRGEVVGLREDQPTRAQVRLVDVGSMCSLPRTALRSLISNYYKLDQMSILCAVNIKNKKLEKELLLAMEKYMKECTTLAVSVLDKPNAKQSILHKVALRVVETEQPAEANVPKKQDVQKPQHVQKSQHVQKPQPSVQKPQPSVQKPTVAPVQILKKSRGVVKHYPKTNPKQVPEEKGTKKNVSDTPLKVEVKVISARTPSDIYLRIKTQEEELMDLYNDMQEFYKNTECDESALWKENDKCATLSPASIWSRGIIQSINMEDKTAKVFLKDTATISEVSFDELRALDGKFLTVRDGAFKCHLSGIIPAGGNKWPNVTCEYVQEQLKEYDRYYITKAGEITNVNIEGVATDKSMPVELWVYHTYLGNALEATTYKWLTINNKIIEQGLALPDKFKEGEPAHKDDEEHLVAEKENTVAESSLLDEMFVPPIVDDWSPALPITKTEFMAMPTYVDDEMYVYLYDLEESETLNMISSTLTRHFQDSAPKPYDMFWCPGQLCIAKWDLDSKYYRARVRCVREDNTVHVDFVDYGNYEYCPIKTLRKDVVLHHIPVQATKCKIAGVKPLGEKWDVKTLDFIHQQVVEKQSRINVIDVLENNILLINLKIRSTFDLAEMLLSLGYAVPDKNNLNTKLPALILPPIVQDDSDPDYIVCDEEEEPNEVKKVDWNDIIDEELAEEAKIIAELQYQPHKFVKNQYFECSIVTMRNINDIILKLSLSEFASMLDDIDRIESEMQRECQECPLIDEVQENMTCVAQFSEDDVWYRARISNFDSEADTVKVFYVDYGNSETLPLCKVRQIKPDWLKTPTQTVMAKLCDIQIKADADLKMLALKLHELLADNFFAKFVCYEGGKLVVKLVKDVKEPTLIYQKLIDEGLMTLPM